MKIKTVYFDCGGVLITNPLREIFTFCGDYFSVPPKMIEDAYFRHEKEYSTGTVTEAQFWGSFIIETGVRLQSPVCDLWEKALPHAYREIDTSVTVVGELKQRGYNVGILSNIEAPTLRYFKSRYPETFHPEVYSCEQGVMKPDNAIYRYAIKVSGNEPGEILFIDDKAENVEAAQNNGLQAVLYTGAGSLLQSLDDAGIPIKEETLIP